MRALIFFIICEIFRLPTYKLKSLLLLLVIILLVYENGASPGCKFKPRMSSVLLLV